MKKKHHHYMHIHECYNLLNRTQPLARRRKETLIFEGSVVVDFRSLHYIIFIFTLCFYRKTFSFSATIKVAVDYSFIVHDFRESFEWLIDWLIDCVSVRELKLGDNICVDTGKNVVGLICWFNCLLTFCKHKQTKPKRWNFMAVGLLIISKLGGFNGTTATTNW